MTAPVLAASLVGILFLLPLEADLAEGRAGQFVRSENPSLQDALTLARGGKYDFTTLGEGPITSIRGAFSRRANLLMLAGAVDRIPPELVVVDWGKRRYLVEPSGLASFCDFARASRGQRPPRFPRMIFYRPMDENAAFPKKLPVLCG